MALAGWGASAAPATWPHLQSGHRPARGVRQGECWSRRLVVALPCFVALVVGHSIGRGVAGLIRRRRQAPRRPARPGWARPSAVLAAGGGHRGSRGSTARSAAGGGPPAQPQQWPPPEVQVSSAPPPSARPEGFAVKKTEQEWRRELGLDRFRILRRKGTEMPNTGEFYQFSPERGLFRCGGCGLPLFSAAAKTKSTSGWPQFEKVIHSGEIGCHVGVEADPDGQRAEIVCARCGGHLGHVAFGAGCGRTGELH